MAYQLDPKSQQGAPQICPQAKAQGIRAILAAREQARLRQATGHDMAALLLASNGIRRYGFILATVPEFIAFYCKPPEFLAFGGRLGSPKDAPRTLLGTDSRAGIPPAASRWVPPAP